MPVTYLDIANQITSRLAAVPNVGRVHHYQRNLTALETVKTEFFDHNLGRIAAWTVSRESFTDTQSSNIENTRVSTWVLRGYMSVEDSQATEVLFQQVIDHIGAAFRPQDDLGDTVELIQPVQARTIGYTMLGKPDSGILCHSAELVLQVQEFYQN